MFPMRQQLLQGHKEKYTANDYKCEYFGGNGYFTDLGKNK